MSMDRYVCGGLGFLDIRSFQLMMALRFSFSFLFFFFFFCSSRYLPPWVLGREDRCILNSKFLAWSSFLRRGLARVETKNPPFTIPLQNLERKKKMNIQYKYPHFYPPRSIFHLILTFSILLTSRLQTGSSLQWITTP